MGSEATSPPMLGHFIAVGFGGALGAMARYGVGVAVVRAFGHGFPLGVLSVNIFGSFLMGVFIVLAAQRGLTPWAPFVVTGVLGGFTTFSAFSLEAVTLYERGEPVQAGLYVVASVAFSIGALVLGLLITRMMTT